MNDQTQKADAGKSDPLLLEVDLADALAAVNAVLDYGVRKYGQRCGWKLVDMGRYNSAARRHRRSRDTGEQTDPETGLLHLAHEACNILFQLQAALEKQQSHSDAMRGAPTPHQMTPGAKFGG